MSAVLAVMKREIQAYFVSPIAYAFIAVFLLLVGFGFVTAVTIYTGIPAALADQLGLTIRTQLVWGQGFATWAHHAALVSLPGLAMRLLSEERKNGTAELLFTSPITTPQIVLGKYFGTIAVYALILILTLPMPMFLATHGRPEIAAIACAYLGLFLFGATILAIGLFTSSLTENQFIALLLSYVVIAPLLFGDLIIPILEAPFDTILASLSIGYALRSMALGILDTGYVVLFLLTIALFLFLSVRVIDSSRWR